MLRAMKACLIATGMLVFATPAAAAKHAKLPYEYYRVGAASDVTTTTTPGTVLMGGSTDVDEAFMWMCSLTGGGDFLIVRATGTDAYNPYVHDLCPGLNSVATLIMPDTAAANHPDVAAILAQAEAVWLAGGDQSDYVLQWTATPVQQELQDLIDRGVPIGGTSAGFNVLTPFVYSAEAPQGVTSDKALADPYNRLVTLTEEFVNIPVLANTLGDPHFLERDRMGRDLAFLARINANGWSAQPRGIEVDEQTALLVDDAGSAVVVGQGSAYFLQTPGAPEVCLPRTPLTYRNVEVYRIDAAGSFDMPMWTGSGGTAYTVSAVEGKLTSTQPGGAIY
jgi:cyanophycinase